ncbi:serine/threonine-protein kinase Nek2-like [Syngnathus typhle]|uniref:serine/threonine-protein kinase Nek2-like n=1 Tax=Syngnathus typhle TaxID=161592 RepID=UPI002A6989DB|nr:serine/threonine-protein kinase Nek2-like [Syngnathus typhle]
MGSRGRCQRIRRKSDGKVLVWKEVCCETLSKSETRTLISKVNHQKMARHPNIVRCYDCIVDSANTKIYVVMEECTGDNLADLIASASRERRHLDEKFILQVIAQLTSALKTFYRKRNGKPIFHHNLKAGNVFLDSEQNVKLGKPSYTNTNQMSFDNKCDIWSLGCLLYELCTLCRYVPSSGQKVLAEKIPARTLIKIPGQYSKELCMLLNNMLNLTDDLRPSMESILQSNLLAEVVEEEAKKAQGCSELAKRNKMIRSARKNKENLAPGDPQLVMLDNIARRPRTDSQHTSQVDKDRHVRQLRF